MNYFKDLVQRKYIQYKIETNVYNIGLYNIQSLGIMFAEDIGFKVRESYFTINLHQKFQHIKMHINLLMNPEYIEL